MWTCLKDLICQLSIDLQRFSLSSSGIMREYQVVSQYAWKGVSATVTYKVICKPRYIDCLFIYVYCGAHSHLTVCDPMDYSPQVSLSMGFSRKKYWSGLPFPMQGIFRTQGSNPCLLYVASLPLCHLGRPLYMCTCIYNVYYKIPYVCKDKYNVYTYVYEMPMHMHKWDFQVAKWCTDVRGCYLLFLWYWSFILFV